MFDSFKDWVEEILGADYDYFPGQWVEDDANAARNFCAIRISGGPVPTLDVRKRNVQLTLVGPRNAREAYRKLISDADSLIDGSLADDRKVPCGAANIRSMGEPVGPGYTTENRAWVSLSFELIF